VDPHPVHPAIPVVPGDPDRAVLADPADTDPADRVDPAARADPDPMDPAAQADPETTDPAAQADPETTDPAAQADPDPMDPAVPVDRAVPAHGMGIASAATSTGPRGATALHPGALARHRGRTGVGRFRRRVHGGQVARSTTGATRRIRCGTPSSTSGASGSSESGFRCNKPVTGRARFAERRSGRCAY
jgi:hypothetical protein